MDDSPAQNGMRNFVSDEDFGFDEPMESNNDPWMARRGQFLASYFKGLIYTLILRKKINFYFFCKTSKNAFPLAKIANTGNSA